MNYQEPSSNIDNPPDKNPVGRPPKFKSAEQLSEKIDEYFDTCDNTDIIKQTVRKGETAEITIKDPYTVAGLEYHLGYSDINKLKKLNPEFAHLIARARKRIETNLVRHGIVGNYDTKITSLVLATHYGYNHKTESDVKLPAVSIKFIIGRIDALPGQPEPKQIEGEVIDIELEDERYDPV